MSSQHDHFVRLVGSGNFSNRIVGNLTLGVVAVYYIELQYNISLISQNARYAAVVLITHYYRGHNFSDIKRAIVESANLSMFSPRVVDAHHDAICFEKLVELFIDLPPRQYSTVGRWGRRRRGRWRW